MPTDTPNHSFFLPDEHGDDWGDEKVSDWQALDRLLKRVSDDGETFTPANFNGVVWADPDEDDFGTAVNDAIARAPPGGIVRLPPVEYSATTTAVVDKFVTIVGSGGFNPNFRTKVTAADDVTVIRNAADTVLALRNLTIDCKSANKQPVVEATTRCYIDNIALRYHNAPGIYLHQSESRSNLNYSQVSRIVAYHGDAPVVKLENTAGDAVNINACEISVTACLDCDYGIDAPSGFGNKYHVQVVEGGGVTAGIRMGATYCRGTITYIEGNVGAGIVFDNGVNVGEIVKANTDNLFQFNNPNNTAIQWTNPAKPFIQQRFNPMRFGGNSIETTEPGEGHIITAPDGGRWLLAVDNTGNLQTTQQ